jgi:hypothetical protein
MGSPPGTYNTKTSPPPVAVSTSLEGLEIGVPPPKRGALWLEKPLPKLPDRTSSICSEESSSAIELVLENHHHQQQQHHYQDDLSNGRKRAKSDSPEPTGRFYRRRNIAHRNSVTRSQERASIGFKTFLTEEQYGVSTHLSKANHYFREKKWEIFPELAPPQAQSVRYNGSPVSSTASSSTSKSARRNLVRPRLPRGFSRQQIYHQGEVFGIDLKPVASQIQQTLVNKKSQLQLRLMKKPSQEGEEEEEETEVRVSVVPRSRNNSSSTNDSDTTTLIGIVDSSDIKRSIAMVRQRMREMSPWSRPGSSDDDSHEGSISLWKSTSTSVLNLVSTLETKVQGSKLAKTFSQPVDVHLSDAASEIESVHDNSHDNHDDPEPELEPEPEPIPQALPKIRGKPIKPILAIQTHFDSSVVSLPECNKTIRAKSSYILIAFDGAKKKLAAVKAARRRAELKKNLHVVGPMDKYHDGSVNQWD